MKKRKELKALEKEDKKNNRNISLKIKRGELIQELMNLSEENLSMKQIKKEQEEKKIKEQEVKIHDWEYDE